jgi:hypothetical protein
VYKTFEFSSPFGEEHAESAVVPPDQKKITYRWYTTGSDLSSLIYMISGLDSIPDLYKFQFATCANAGCFVGHKEMNEVAESTKDAHRYGLEVDIMPYFLQYWKLSDLKSVLVLALYSTTFYKSDRVITNTTEDIFKYLTLENQDTYVHVPLAFNETFNKLNMWLSKFEMTYKKNVDVTNEKSKVKTSYTTMLDASVSDPDHYKDPETQQTRDTYKYTIDEYVDTYHVRVRHTFDRATGKPILNKALRFKINYYTSASGKATGVPPITPEEFNQLVNNRSGSAFRNSIESMAVLLGLTTAAFVVNPLAGIIVAVGASAYWYRDIILSAFKKPTTRAGDDFKPPYASVEFYFGEAKKI